MANTKISELNALTGANLNGADLLPIVDSSATETKSITVSELKTGIFASPTFSGTPVGPTALIGTNDTQLATTEFVSNAVAAGGGGGGSGGGSLATLTDTNLTGLTDGEIIVYNSSADKYLNRTLDEAGIATIASPSFTGTPVGPTASAGANTAQLATTEFVTSAVAGINGINSAVQSALDAKANLTSPAFTGNPTAATPTANTHLTTKDYVDSQLGGVAGNTVIVKKVTGAEMAALTTSSSTWIELIPAPGAGNFIAVREFECYIDRGGSAASGVAAWKPTVSGNIRGFNDDVQLAFRNTSGQTNFQYNTFGVLQKAILNHLINGVFNTSAANTDIILVRDSPVTQTRAYPNVPLLLKPKSASTTANFTTYSSTATHTLNDDYYLRISYRVMSLSSHFQVT